MITFYPRDIGMWRNDFDFSERHGLITLVCKEKTHYKTFHDRDELIGFLKQHGVRLDDANNPLEITGPHDNPMFGKDTYNVIQWSLLGWIKDNYVS